MSIVSTKARIGMVAAAVSVVAGLGVRDGMSQSGIANKLMLTQPDMANTLKSESSKEPEQSTSPTLPAVHTPPRTPAEPETAPVIQSPGGYSTSTSDPVASDPPVDQSTPDVSEDTPKTTDDESIPIDQDTTSDQAEQPVTP